MAEQNQTATPPAASGGNADLEARIKEAIAAALGPITKSLGELAGNQKVLADTLAQLPPAAAKEEKKAKGEESPRYLTAEDLSRLLAEREAAGSAQAKKAAVRQKVIDARLKDVPAEFFAHLPDTDDEKALGEAADKIVARVNEVLKVKQPDVGGAGRDGGKTPGSAAGGEGFKNVGLTDGMARFAQGLKMPAAAGG